MFFLTNKNKLRLKYEIKISEVLSNVFLKNIIFTSVNRFKLLKFIKKYADFRRHITLRQKRTSTSIKLT